MKDWWKIAFGVVCGLLGAGIILLVSSPPQGQPISLNPFPSPAPIIIYVTGAVNQPGVYSLPPESRVQDAILAAGGTAQDADLQALNLATLLTDGCQVLVPTLPPYQPNNGATSTPIPSRGGNEDLLIPSSEHPININTASHAELESLPGIGPYLAQQIISYREANGPFTSIEDIIDVYGIGQSTFELIKDLITVE